MNDNFIKNSLKPILKTEIDDEIVAYIKDMKTLEDFEEFISNIVDRENAEHVRLCQELKNKLFEKSHTKSKSQKQSQSDFPSLVPNQNERSPTAHVKEPQNNTQAKEHFPSLVQGKTGKHFCKSGTTTSDPTTPDQKQPSKEGRLSSGKGKKTKYVNVENFNLDSMLKKGRHPCDCEATEHALINNCCNCGRIVCEQEGSGPCFFCDTMVCTNDELRLLESNSKESDKFYNKLKDQKKSKEWKKAIELRDKLVKADRSGEYKNKIYDDQTDYWSSDSKRRSKKEMKFALDLATRSIQLEDNEFHKHKKDLMRGVNKLLDISESRLPRATFEAADVIGMLTRGRSDTQKVLKREKNNLHKGYKTSEPSSVKVSVDAFLKEIDQGMCLSMHQPWASLLVAGIKIHEGRTWYTPHRGRLWIHAASKEPTNNEILAVEEMYRDIYKDPELEFPRKYPISCLIGCVNVEDCLKQDQYREVYEDGESDSPYVLICSKPMILPVFYPMQGQHKIFPLTKDVHSKAKEALLSANWV